MAIKLLPSFLAKRETASSDYPDTAKSPIGMSGGTFVSPDSSMQVSAFHRGVTYLITQIAKLPWEVKTDDNQIVRDSVHHLLRYSPNPEMSSFNYRLLVTFEAIVYGNHYSEIERDVLGRVINIWPIERGCCRPVRATNGTLLYEISGIASSTGNTTYLRSTDVFKVSNFHTTDGITSQGVVAYAIDTLGIAKGADRFANSLFANGGMPSGTLETDNKLNDEAYSRIVKGWKSAHGGKKTGGTAVLEDGVKYKAISYSPDVLQFLESRKFSVIEIARFLNVPPQKLFDSESATYNNIEHANIEVVTDTLDAWAKNYESETEIKLLLNNKATYATKCEMDLRAIFRGDMNTRTNYFKGRMSTASMSPNEIRLLEGDAPYTGGDDYYIQANNYSPVGRLDEIIDSQISKNTDKDAEKEDDKDLKKIVENMYKN